MTKIAILMPFLSLLISDCECQHKLKAQNDMIDAAARGDDVNHQELLDIIASVAKSHDEKAVKPLISLLESTKDASVANACIMALGELGSEEAMPAIIDYAERKPSIIRRQAIIAARLIGSKLAAGWLMVMAHGYDDPVVRKEAQGALDVVLEKLAVHSQEENGP